MKKMTFPSELQFRRFLEMFDREIKVVYTKVFSDGRTEVGLQEVDKNEPGEQSLFSANEKPITIAEK